MIVQRVIFHPFPIFTSELDTLFWVPAETDLLLWMLTREAMQCTGSRSTWNLAVLLNHLTASRCEVAKHAATLVFDCEVFPRCESIGRHARVVETHLHFLGFERCSLRERHCYCPCDAGGHRILFSHLFSVLVFSLYAWLCFRCSVVDVCFCACSVHTSHLFHLPQGSWPSCRIPRIKTACIHRERYQRHPASDTSVIQRIDTFSVLAELLVQQPCFPRSLRGGNLCHIWEKLWA